jgi:hypothetical protein
MRIRIFFLILLSGSYLMAADLFKSRGFTPNSCYYERGVITCASKCSGCTLDLYPQSAAQISFQILNKENFCNAESPSAESLVYFKTSQDVTKIKVFKRSKLSKKTLAMIQMNEGMNPQKKSCPLK